MITKTEMEQILDKAKSSYADFSELFFENRNDVTFKYSDRKINDVTSLHINGAGLYVMNGLNSIYVYSSDTSFAALMGLAEQAAELIRFVSKRGTVPCSRPLCFEKYPTPCKIELLPNTVGLQEKVQVARDTCLAAISAGPAADHVETAYYDQIQNVAIANSEGLYTEDRRVHTRLKLIANVESGGQFAHGSAEYTMAQGFELFRDPEDYLSFARRHIRSLETSIHAKPVKRSCVLPVIFEKGDTGTFWHETCGHNLETTSISEGLGDFGDKMGMKVASEKVTLVDDGTLAGGYGSQAVDDEGCPTQKNVLIENGVIKDFLCDRMGARRYNLKQNGSARRQSYQFAPAARMHNTYLDVGQDDEDEMIRSLPEGLYVKSIGGGESGTNFSIGVDEGYWIENGEITYRVKGINLSGSSSDVIKKVDRVGNKLEICLDGGYCGASSGLVPVLTASPRVRVSAMNVAGSEE